MNLMSDITEIRDRLAEILSAPTEPGVPTTYAVSGSDVVTHPSHYVGPVPGIECIQVTQHFNFNRGNVIKYVWRAGAKGDEIEDLRKARQYLDFEIDRLTTERNES